MKLTLDGTSYDFTPEMAQAIQRAADDERVGPLGLIVNNFMTGKGAAILETYPSSVVALAQQAARAKQDVVSAAKATAVEVPVGLKPTPLPKPVETVVLPVEPIKGGK